MEKNIKVLYIAGTSRSGSTILSNLLGQIDGYVNVGEIMYLWDRGLIENWICSCEKSFGDCLFWNAIVESAFKDEEIHPDEILKISERGRYENGIKRIRFRELIAKSSDWLVKNKIKEFDEYVKIISKIYTAINNLKGCRFIVDSSKRLEYGFILKNTPNIELYVLHLIRDPRAVVYSQVKRNKLLIGSPDKINMKRDGAGLRPIFATVRDWLLENFLIEKLLKKDVAGYIKIRYEDFTKDPKFTVKKILDLINEDKIDLSFLEKYQINMRLSHIFSGNPIRFTMNNISIKIDEEWKGKMNLSENILITSLSLCGLIKYGYINFNKT